MGERLLLWCDLHAVSVVLIVLMTRGSAAARARGLFALAGLFAAGTFGLFVLAARLVAPAALVVLAGGLALYAPTFAFVLILALPLAVALIALVAPIKEK